MLIALALVAASPVSGRAQTGPRDLARVSIDDLIGAEGRLGISLAILNWMMPCADGPELCRRIRQDERHAHNVDIRVLTLQDRVAERQTALSKVKQFSGLLPICSYCKRIRGDENYGERVENYITEHTDATFSHGICPTCYDTVLWQIEGRTPAC